MRTNTGSLNHSVPGFSWGAVLLTGLALSIGWGVRGNWGHEYGAMIPGALAALAAALLAGREDWRRRAVFFAFFGALGWSFGGSMSYGRVLGYTHSDSPPDVLYGFACTFAIGFLWAAMGGAGTALPACLDRDRLTGFFPPLLAIFAAWALWDYILFPAFLAGRTLNLNWYDTDWVGAALALLAMLLFLAVRRRVSAASSLILYMIAGWWAGFLGLVVLLGLRMTPPRSDNWAGCVGMTAALLLYLLRNRLAPVAFAALLSGFFGGFGFSTGELIKLLGISTGLATNWHSVMEQSYGFIQGLGIAVAMGYLSTRAPRAADDPPVRLWTESFSVAFILLAVTYLNISKNVRAVWLPNKVLPEQIYDLPAQWWFNLAYLALAIAVIALIGRHHRAPLPVVPSASLGKGQLFFLLFLWWIVIGNLSRYLPFHPARMVTEGVIHLNACLASALVLLWPKERELVPELPPPDYGRLLRRVALAGLAVMLAAVLLQTAVTLPLSEGPASGARFRFGPRALEGW